MLKEKFALHTELSKLKPELEHLRAESAAHQEILSEKLALQRQLSTVQVELENSQRAAERAKSKAGKNSDQDAEREAQLDDLHKQLAEARHSLKEAKREVNSLQKDLDSEKRAVEQNGANETRESGVLEELVQKLRTELTLEKKERQKADKALDKERQTWEAEKSIRDDKLAQFRSKLRATKEDKLALEAEVQKLQEEVSKKTTMVDTARPLAKNPRKRAAAQMGPDATIGTPGDALPSKKGKRAAASMPGEKSTFSITPFLNKTGGAAHESDDDSELEDSMAQHASAKRSRVESEAESEAEVAPAAAATKPASKKALAPAPSKKQNANTSAPARKAKAAAKPSLELVAEEADENGEADEDANDAPADVEPETTVAVAAPVAAAPAPKLKPKVPAAKKAPRKSLAEFSTFDTGDDGKVVVKKKRKLLGGGAGAGSLLGKTLFDDEDDAEAPKPKPIPGRGAFLAKGGSKLLKGAAGTQPAKKQAAGFGFSPLKKDKRAAKLAASVLA